MFFFFLNWNYFLSFQQKYFIATNNKYPLSTILYPAESENMQLIEKCPVLKELEEKLQEIEELVGPEECIEYCYYSFWGPGKDATQMVWYERREDLGVYRVYVKKDNKWILIEEKPC